MTLTAVTNIRKEPYYRRAAVEAGLRRLGYSIAISPPAGPQGRGDLLVTWNLAQGATEKQAREWESKGGTVIVMENAYLQKVDKTTYALSTHGHNGSGWFPVGGEDRFTSLGFPLAPMQYRQSGYALVCGQRGIGSSTMASPPHWAEKQARTLTGPVRVRPHPGNFAPKTSLTSDLAGARVCHIWASGAGVTAMVHGIPVYYSAPHWVCSEGAGLAAPDGARRSALNTMAHGQWRHEEIATGEPFARMRDAGWGPTWP